MHEATMSFKARAEEALANPTLKIAIDRTTGTAERKRAVAMTQFPQFDAARERGQIVLYDGGSLMGSALTLFASKAADVIVLAVPLLDQDQETLIEVADNLPADRSRVLAVTTSPMRRRNRRPEPSTSDTSAE